MKPTLLAALIVAAYAAPAAALQIDVLPPNMTFPDPKPVISTQCVETNAQLCIVDQE